MRSLFLVGLILLAQVSYRCATDPDNPFGTVALYLKPGEPQTANGVSVTFDSVISDSRCPLNAVCIQFGDARVKFFIVTKNGPRRAVELTLVEPATNTVRADNGATILFSGLLPYPEAGHTFNPAAFRASVQVLKAP
jgi:hypothetical protein